MPVFTLGKAAKLYGLHRTTLYLAMREGRLSVGLNGKGQKVVDLSEMIRVWGEPPVLLDTGSTTSTCKPSTTSTASSVESSTPPAAGVLQSLLVEIQQIRAQLDEQVGLIEEMRDKLKLLEHKPAKVQTDASRARAESFSDLLRTLDDD